MRRRFHMFLFGEAYEAPFLPRRFLPALRARKLVAPADLPYLLWDIYSLLSKRCYQGRLISRLSGNDSSYRTLIPLR